MALTSVGGLTPSRLLGLIWGAVAIATLFTIIRTWIRLKVYRKLFADDAIVYLALAILISMCSMYQSVAHTMFVIDSFDEPAGGVAPPPSFFKDAETFLKMQFAIICLFWTTLWAVKLSFLLYYKSLFAKLPDLLFWWRLVTPFVVLAYLGCWATQLASCAPLSDYFSLGACETKRDVWVSNFSLYYSTAVDILCDLLIMALPLRLLWKSQINKQQKSALAAIFSLGFIIIIFAIIRVIATKASIHHVDPVWLALWSMIEASVAVVVACLPSFRVLLRSKREDSAYNRRNNFGSGERRGSSKQSWRMKNRKHGSMSFESGGYGGGESLPTEQFAGAERIDSFAADPEAGDMSRAGGSKEHILPKPQGCRACPQ